MNMTTMLIKEAQAIVGGLSNPAKMPGKSTSLPPQMCNVGAKLRNVAGSVCEGCYAYKGNYSRFKNVGTALTRRLESLNHPDWIPAMVTLIERLPEPYFRWHDAGDLQSIAHLERIVAVCNATPHIKHWIPTHEYGIVRQYRAQGGVIPANLVIRESAVMVDGPPPVKNKLPTSTVVTDGSATCPAPTQGGECGPCRDCWDPTVQNVAYSKH
jgi:hypothetical protein